MHKAISCIAACFGWACGLGACTRDVIALRPDAVVARGDLAVAADALPVAADLSRATPVDFGDCPAGEIAFDRAAGCDNDGSNEFCIPLDGADALRARLAAIDPRIACAPGGGRARCDGAQLLCFIPNDPADCEAPHGAMTPAAWARLCAIASLDEVTRIVPTVFE